MTSLEPNRLYHDQFAVIYSGLELVLDDYLQKVVIDYVYAGAPAEEAGLKAGDEVVHINGTSTSRFSLPQIRSMLNQEYKEIKIFIDRKGELHSDRFRLLALIE